MEVKFLRAARSRLLEIWDYTERTWGEAQADKYVRELVDAINQAADSRDRWRPVMDEMLSGVYYLRYQRHFVLFRELSPGALDKLLGELADFLSLCSCEGIWHRDLSDGNILVKRDPDGKYRFFLLDTNRIRCKNRVGTLRGLKSLIRLGIPRDRQRTFLAHYVHRSSISGWLWLWYRLNKVSYTNFVAIKRVLGLRKIAQKLKIQ